MQAPERISPPLPLVLLLVLLALVAPPASQGFTVGLCARSATRSGGRTQGRPLQMCGEAPVFVPAGQAAGPRESTWSNPGGQDLLPVGEGLYAAERPFVWNGIDVGKLTAACPPRAGEKRKASPEFRSLLCANTLSQDCMYMIQDIHDSVLPCATAAAAAQFGISYFEHMFGLVVCTEAAAAAVARTAVFLRP